MATADAKGYDVYHACATYQNKEGVWNERKQKMEVRAQSNVWGLRALYVDVDAGSGGGKATPYVDATAAADAVLSFCDGSVFNLPSPVFVGSGYGLHCYWPLDTVLNPTDWYRLASGLAVAARNHGVILDPTTTTDTARVLRTPGTHNHKYGRAVRVECGPLVAPYPLARFTPLLGLSQPVRAVPPAGAATQTNPLTAAITSGIYDPFYADQVADGCNQVAQFRSNNDRYGPVLEPLWYACIGVTAFCIDGDEKTHAWSGVHPNYSQQLTDDRLKRARQLSGATTCQKFQSVNLAGCAACIHKGKITSPISLGHQRTLPATSSPASLSTPFSQTTSPATSASQEADAYSLRLTEARRAELYGVPLPPLRDPWKWSSEYQLTAVYEEDGKPDIKLICNYPCFLEGVQTGEVGESAYSYHFKQFLPHEGWQHILIPAEQLMGPSGIAKLYGKGVVVHDVTEFNSYVRAAVDTFNSEQSLRTRYDQFGWKNDDAAFLCGSRLYTASSTQETIGSEEVKGRSAWLRPKPGGSLAAWTATANALFQTGCEVQAFALLCSFAAPLMRFHTVTEGGAIIALHSRGSAKGKSTALAAISSVWGEQKGLELTNTDTGVSKGITLGVLSNLPVIYDELQHQDAEVIRDFVRIFTNGRDKMRGTSGGTIRHTQSNWQTILVSASNASLTDTLYHSSGIDALAFRVLELPVILPPTIDTTQGDRLKRQLEHNAGYAGDAYLKMLLQPAILAWAKTALESWTADLWKRTALPTEHRFRIRLLGAVAVAAALVNKMQLLTFDPQRLLDWAVEKVVEQKDDAPTTGHDTEVSVEALATYLAEHLSDTLVMPDAYSPGQRVIPLVTPMRKMLVRYEKNNGRILLAAQPLRAWLIRNEIGYRPFIADLQKTLVVTAPRRLVTLAAGTDYPGAQVVCIEVNAFHPALGGVLSTVGELVDRRSNVVTLAKK